MNISLEPTAHGEQLRLTALKEDAMILNGFSALMGGISVVMGTVVAAASR